MRARGHTARTMPTLSDSFAPVRLYLDDIIEGTHGGPMFSTDVATNHGGYEQRNANWAYPLGRWELGQRGYCQSTKDYIQSFFRQRRGKFQGFLWRDLADHTASATPLASLGGFTTQGWLVAVAGSGGGAGGAMQLIKRYTDGAYLAERIITHPVASSLPAGWAVDPATGYVSAPGVTAPIAVSFEFDVPVRFDTDALSLRLQSTEGHPTQVDYEAIFYVETLPIVELRNSLFAAGSGGGGGNTGGAVATIAWGDGINSASGFDVANAGSHTVYQNAVRLYFSMPTGAPAAHTITFANSTFASYLTDPNPNSTAFDPQGEQPTFSWNAALNLGCIYLPRGPSGVSNLPPGSVNVVLSLGGLNIGQLALTVTDATGSNGIFYDQAQWLAYAAL